MIFAKDISLLQSLSPAVREGTVNWEAIDAGQEMLLQADGATLRLLPALPRAWTHGAATGLCAPGGVRVDLDWDGPSWRASLSLDPGFPPRSLDVYAPGETEPRPVALAPGARTEVAG